MPHRFAVLIAALAAPLFAALPASAAATTHIWMQQGYTASQYVKGDSTVAQYILDNTGSYGMNNGVTSAPTVPYPGTSTPALRYTSYAQFTADIANHVIPNASWPKGSVVVYDLEGGKDLNGNPWSPPDEQQDPEMYMPLFNRAAINAGFKPIDTPGLDLGDTDTTCTKASNGGTNVSYFEGCHIAKYAVDSNGTGSVLGMVVQAQTQTADETSYTTLCKDAKADANGENSSAFVLDEVSINYGTALEATNDLQNMGKANVDGVFIQGTNADAATPGGWEDSILTTLYNKGW